MLIGSSPKRDAVRQSSPWQDYTDISTVGGQTEPKLLVVIYVKQGKPVFLLFIFRKADRKECRWECRYGIVEKANAIR